MKGKLLITAAGGTVGSVVTDACLAKGLPVLVGSRNTQKAEARFQGAQHVNLDLADRATWAAALDGVEAVFLLRPPAMADVENNLCPFIDACRAAGVAHIVFLSVAGAEQHSWVPHRKVELHLAGKNDHTVLRPGFFAQNLETAYRQDIVDDNRLYVPAKQGRVAFLDVLDIADVAVTVFVDRDRHLQMAYTLTGPEAHTFADVAALLTAVLGRPITYEPASVPGYIWHLWRKQQLPIVQAIVQTVLHTGLARGDAEAVLDTVRQLTGNPSRSFRAYLERRAQRFAGARAMSEGTA